MVWIETKADAAITVRAAVSDTFTLIRDIAVTGAFTPGVVRIEEVGEREFHWVMKMRRGVGTTFTPDYVCRYVDNGENEMTFETVSGNVKTNGTWRVFPIGDNTRVAVTITTGLDAPVPRLMKKPAELFARREARAGLEAQLERMKSKLERG